MPRVLMVTSWGEAICGIIYVDNEGHRSSVHWYVPQPPPDLIYS